MLKNFNKPMATCHDIGACLLHPDDCACTKACLLQVRQDQQAWQDKQARQALRLAPGVIDGPYLRRSRARQFTMDMLVALALIAAMTVLVELVVRAHAAGWF